MFKKIFGVVKEDPEALREARREEINAIFDVVWNQTVQTLDDAMKTVFVIGLAGGAIGGAVVATIICVTLK